MMSNLSIQAPEAEPAKSAVVQAPAAAARPQQAPQTRAPAVCPSKTQLRRTSKYVTINFVFFSTRSLVAARFTLIRRRLQFLRLQYNKLDTRETGRTKSVLRTG
jgi:hypothetical protein